MAVNKSQTAWVCISVSLAASCLLLSKLLGHSVSTSSSSIRDHYYLLHIGLLRGFKQDNPFKEFITLPDTTKCAINVT